MSYRSIGVLAVVTLASITGNPRLLGGQDVAVITGRITSVSGSPVFPATVIVEGMSVSANANEDGRYRLSVSTVSRLPSAPLTLRVRALGFVPQSRNVAPSAGVQTEDFVLRADINRLEEVVVTGTINATSQKKLGYTVTKLGAADLPVPGSNVLEGLQGKVTGAIVVQPSGRPGASPAIVLRGPKSLAAGGRQQGPLLIVDGAILNSGAQDLDAQDIENIEIVKGAAAASLYGSRAAAGVIQITTKTGGRAGQNPHVTLRSELGMSDIRGEYRFARRHMLMMDEHNERFCIREAGQPACSRTVDFEEEAERVNNTPSFSALTPRVFERDYGLTAPSIPELKGLFQINQWPRSYDPVAQAVTSGAYRNSSLSIASHANNTDYYASLSDLAQQGSMRFLRGYRRNTLRVNVDQTLGESWHVALRSTYAAGTQFPATDGSLTNVAVDDFFRLTRVPAGVNLLRYDAYGRLFIRSNPLAGGAQSANPLYAFANSEGRLDDDRLIASLTVTYTPATWLTIDAIGGTDRLRASEFIFRDREYRTTQPFGAANGGSLGYVYQGQRADLSQNFMLSGRSQLRLASQLTGAFTTRFSLEREEISSSSAEGSQLAVSGPKTLALATPSTVTITSAGNSIRALGALAGAQLEYRERYIVDALLRYDGSSLFGANERWNPYYRGSLAWRISDESFWPFPKFANEAKLRGSVGTAGGRPRFEAQYETFRISSGGQVDAATTLGNPNLKPERTIETEFGIDAELLGKYGMSLTYARDITTDQLLRIPAPVGSGYPNKWQNAGALDSKTLELSLRVPLIARRGVSWNAQIGWDRTRTYITALNRAPFFEDIGYPGAPGSGVHFYYAPGERYGTIYAHKFITSCDELPAPYDTQCGPDKEWQRNDEGYVVWVGQGRSWTDGVTDNLWQAIRAGCLKNGIPLTPAPAGAAECLNKGGTVNAPWGVPVTHWGMPMLLRDSSASAMFVAIGNTMPDYRVSMAHSVQWGRFSLYGLLDVSRGNRMVNLERQWSLLEFNAREEDQDGKTPQTAKPLGYYWRAAPPVGVGTGGFYDNQLNGSNRTIEDASYAKLRELSLAYDLRNVPVLGGEWSVSLIGRNLHTWTKYPGLDPEVNETGSASNFTQGEFGTQPQVRYWTARFNVNF